jgi:hypothetical protein
LIAQELDGLKARGKELTKRLDACAAACLAYIEFSAPRAQVPAEAEPLPPEKKPAPAPGPAPKKQPALKKKPAAKPAPEPTSSNGG